MATETYTCRECGEQCTMNRFHDLNREMTQSHPLLMGQTAERYCLPTYRAANTTVRFELLSKDQKSAYITNGR